MTGALRIQSEDGNFRLELACDGLRRISEGHGLER